MGTGLTIAVAYFGDYMTVAGTVLRQLPKSLYKYSPVSDGRIDRIKRYLLNSKLYFSSMSAFNDPLDCRIPFVFEATDAAAAEYWQTIADAIPGQSAEQKKARILELIAQTKDDAGRKRLTDQQFTSLQRHGILSLTKHPDSMPMWAYYGESHSGVVLRLNMSPDILLPLTRYEQCVIVPAVYHSDFPKINFYGSDDQKIHDVLGAKAAAWKHEEEWRIVFINGANRHIAVPPEMIDGVVLGVRTSAEHEAQIREWIAARKAKTDLLRVRNKPHSFELELVPVDA